MFTPIQKILPKAIKTIGIKKEVEAAVVCDKFRKIAPTLLPPRALENIFPKFYKNKRLVIGVLNPAWAHVVIQQKEALIKALNSAIGEKTLVDLVTKIVDRIKSDENIYDSSCS